MSTDERSVLAEGGPAAVAMILAGQVRWRWQLAGEAVLALPPDADGRERAAAVVVAALLDRGDRGDWLLAAHLVRAVGLPGPVIEADHGDRVPELTPLRVDLDMLADVLDSRGSGGWLQLATGQTWELDPVDDALSDDEVEERTCAPSDWLWVDPLGSGAAYQDMADFTDEVADDRLGRVLSRALSGRKPFRAFADAIYRADEEQLSRWSAFRDERRAGRARRWLAEAGYLAMPMVAHR